MKIRHPLSRERLRYATLLWWLLAAMPAPARAAVYHVAQTQAASDENPGTEEKPFRTISHAAGLAQAGDVVLVQEGVYRECVRPHHSGSGPDRRITYKAVEGGRVVIKGSELFSPQWEPVVPGNANLADYVKAELPETLLEPHPELSRKAGKPVLCNPFQVPLMLKLHNPLSERYAQRTPDYKTPFVVGEIYVLDKPRETTGQDRAGRILVGSVCGLALGRRGMRRPLGLLDSAARPAFLKRQSEKESQMLAVPGGEG